MPALEPLGAITTDSQDHAAPAPGTLGALPDAEDRRREFWEDDSADAAGWREEHARLGVLPSPSVQESIGPGSPGKARKGSWIGEVVESPVVEERREEEERINGELPQHQSLGRDEKISASADREQDDETAKLSDTAAATAIAVGAVQSSTLEHETGELAASKAEASPMQHRQHDEPLSSGDSAAVHPSAPSNLPTTSDPEPRRASLDNDKVRRPSVKHTQSRSASFATPAAAATRPAPIRKFSALDQLPSQQRRRQFTPVATPRRMSLADDGVVSAPLSEFEPMPTDTPARETKASRPVTPAKWDLLSMAAAPKGTGDAASRRSSVSSLGDPQSQDTVIIPGAASKRQSVVGIPVTSVGGGAPDSQQRAVSPLPTQGDNLEVGQQRNVSPLPLDGHPLENSQQRNVSPLPINDATAEIANDGQQHFVSPLLPHEAFATSSVPTMEPNSMLGVGRPEEDRFMSRDYRSTQQMDQRPMSYIPHSRSSSNVMMQDSVDSAQANKTFSYQQQQPSQPPSRAPSIMQPPSEYDKLRSPQAGDLDPAIGGSSSKHSSGFFRGSDVPAGGFGTIPSPSKLDANYDGLIDPQVSEFADEIAKAEQPPPQPQKRRKSGIMDTFRRSSTISGANASRPSSRGSSPKVMAANPTESSLAKTKTLKKPQRAPSSAVDPPKNKRFSSLGSLFRRSSTMTPRSSTHTNAQAGAQASSPQSATVTPKASKRLTKAQPPQQQQQQSQPQPQRQQYVQRPASYYTNPPPGDYAAYEAMSTLR